MNSIRNRKIQRRIIMVIPLVVTILLWGWGKYYLENPLEFKYVFKYLGQVLGLIGIILLSINYILSTRLKSVEKIYGGLDQTYKTHSHIGKLALLLMLAHPFVLVLDRLVRSRGFDETISLILPFTGDTSLPKNAAIIGLIIYLGLILVTIFRFLPYNLWKFSHKLIGLPFFLIAFHGLNAEATTKYFEPLRDWMIVWIILGIFAYIYKTFLFDFIGPKFSYKVIDVIHHKSTEIVDLLLTPVRSRMSYDPGQFAFIRIKTNEMISSEEHPFTISSNPSKDILRFSIKNSGDYTSKMELVKKDDVVDVYGGFGEFTSYTFDFYKKQVWIAAGIGVTPFLSMLAYEVQNMDKKEIIFFYCTKSEDDAPYLGEIRDQIKRADDKIKFIHHKSSESGRMSISEIKSQTRDLSQYLYLMCGPKPMTSDISSQLQHHEVSRDQIVFEDFVLR